MSSSVEILGQWITLPDPDSVASLSNRYYGVCTALADAKSQLSAIGSPQSEARWIGLSADAFAARLRALPGELEQAWQSYNAVARALSGYSGNLRPVVAALRSLAYQAEEAQGTLNATQAAHDQAVRTAQSTAGVWTTRLAEAKAAVSALARRRSSLLEELDQLSAECVRQIHQASPENVHQDLLSDLKRYAADAGHVLWRAGDDLIGTPLDDLFVRPFQDLWDDATSPGKWDWGKLAGVLSDISGVLGVLAVVIAPIPGLDAVDAFLVPASIVTGALGATAEGIALAEGEKDASWTDFAFDVAGVALMGSSRVIGQGLKLADGPEAKVAGKSLLKSGSKYFFRLPPDADPHPVPSASVGSRLKDSAYRWSHGGAEKGASPSEKPSERTEFGLDRANDGLNIVHEQIRKDQKDGGS
jgi:hypothetical protein